MSDENTTLRDLCRLCAKQTKQRFQIFSDSGKAVSLQQLIWKLTRVEVKEEDGFPQQICRNCYRGLIVLRDKIETLRKSCSEAQVRFRYEKTAPKSYKSGTEDEKERISPLTKSPLRKKSRLDAPPGPPICVRSLNFDACINNKTALHLNSTLSANEDSATPTSVEPISPSTDPEQRNCSSSHSHGRNNSSVATTSSSRKASEIILSAGVRKSKVTDVRGF